MLLRGIEGASGSVTAVCRLRPAKRWSEVSTLHLDAHTKRGGVRGNGRERSVDVLRGTYTQKRSLEGRDPAEAARILGTFTGAMQKEQIAVVGVQATTRSFRLPDTDQTTSGKGCVRAGHSRIPIEHSTSHRAALHHVASSLASHFSSLTLSTTPEEGRKSVLLITTSIQE